MMDFSFLQPGAAPAPEAGAPDAGVPAPEVPMMPPQEPAMVTQQPAQPGFMEKLRTDPALTQAMLLMGARLAQGRKPGQDDIGMLGDAAVLGMTAHNMIQHNVRQQGIQDQELAMKQGESTARIGQMEANTAEARQNTEQKAELFPDTKAKLAQEVKNLRTQGRIQEAQALIQEFNSDPGRLADKWKLDQSAAKAGIARDYSTAGLNADHAKLYREQAEHPEKFAGKGGSSAQVLNREDLRKSFKVQYPTLSDAEIERMVTDHETTQRRKVSQEAFVDFATKGGYAIDTKAGMEKALAAYDNVQKHFGDKSKSGASAPAPAPAAAPVKQFTDADLKTTLERNPTKTRDQVLADAKARGYTYTGSQ